MKSETIRIGSETPSLNDALRQGKGAKHAVPDDLAEAMKQGDRAHKVGFRDRKEKPASLARAMRQ